MTLFQFLRILWARQWVIWLIFVVTVGATVGVSLWLPKRYEATATVLVDVKAPDPLQNQGLPPVIAPGYMATQVDIINSDRVAQRVVRTLGIDKSPQAIAQWREAGDGRGTVEQYFADALQKSLEVKPARESNVIAITFISPEPEFAATVANTFAKAYIDTNVELKADPARDYAVWFDARSKQLRDELEQAQNKLSDYQREKGIVATEERLDIENARLAELSAQLTAVQAQRADSSSRERQASAQMRTSPDVLNSPVIQTLRADVARAESKLEELAKQLGVNHPQYQRSLAEVDSLKSKLDGEMRQIASSVGTTNTVNVQREGQIKYALDDQKRRLLELRAQRDEVAVLQRDVATAQRAYDLVAQRFSQTSLESKTQQTNVAVLSPASPPTASTRPRVLLNTIVAVFAGLVLGISAALLLELARRRLRGPDDITQALGLPVLTSVPRYRPARRWALFRRRAPLLSA